MCDSEKYKLLWDFKYQTDQRMDHNKPDVVLLNKEEKSCLIIDVACPFDTRVFSKEKEKIENYYDLKHEIKHMWNCRSVQVIPLVIGALGTITRGFGNWLSHLGMCLTNGISTAGQPRSCRETYWTRKNKLAC